MDKAKSPHTRKDTKARLASALRDNLRRRKAAQKRTPAATEKQNG